MKSSCLARMPKVPKVSAFVLATVITIVGVLLTSNIVVAITSVISEDAATELALSVTRMMKEKTALRINSVLSKATGVADGAQAGFMIAPAPMPHEDDPATWFRKWHALAVMYHRSFTYSQALTVSFWFEDGSFATAATPYGRFICERWLGSPIRVSPSTILNITTIHYNYSNMKTITTTNYVIRADQRRSVPYNQSLPMFSYSFKAVDVSTISYQLSLCVSFPIYNGSSAYLGVGEVQLRLDSFKDLVETWAPTKHSQYVLLSRRRRVIASGSPGLQAVDSSIVAFDYNLTVVDVERGCTLSPSVGTFVRQLFCLKDSIEFGYEPLRVMDAMGLIPSSLADGTVSGEVRRVKLGHLGYYYISVVDFNQYFPSLDWISIVFVPEKEILEGIVKGRNIAIGVSLAVAIFFAVANGIILRVVLLPLSIIADRMQSSAYLKEDSSTKYAEGDHESEGKLKISAPSALSYLTDVAAIQAAYYRMSDELGILRGYIPEHVRAQLLASHNGITPSTASSESSNNEEIESPNDPPQQQEDPEESSTVEVTFDVTEGALPAQPTEAVSSLPISGRDFSDGEEIELFDIQIKQSDSLPSFIGNGLVERNISVALINVVGLHHHVASTAIETTIKEHEYFVAYVHEVARRFGGVLDNFNGDKFWVSFNSSTQCEHSAVAATLFSYEVATTVNGEAAKRSRHIKSIHEATGKPPLSPQCPRFRIADNGVTIGVSTGKAYVGSLGTRHTRRHAVICNAMSEASVLERLAARYPDSGVVVGGDMIPAIEGYFQYLLLDAIVLPGGAGLRRHIASIKSPMHSKKKPPIPVLLEWSMKARRVLPKRSPYFDVNACFKDFLEGQPPEVITKQLSFIGNHIDMSRQLHLSKRVSAKNLPDGRVILSPPECDSIVLMLGFLSAVSKEDGKQYTSPMGGLFER